MTFLDPLQAVAKSEQEARLPFVFPEKFENRYKEMPDGSRKPEEWVYVKKKGQQNGQVTPWRWRDIERTPDMLAVLKPYYDNWKAGQAAPVNGTPLDVWIADAGLIEVLNSVNIRSVEDFANMEDHLLGRLNIPGVRDRQKRARAFLDAQGTTAKVSAEVAKLREENENLRRNLEEMKELIEKHAIKKEEETVKRGPGRPRKHPIEAA